MVRYMNIILFLIIIMGGVVIGYLIYLLIKLNNNKKIPKQSLDYISNSVEFSCDKISEDGHTQMLYTETDENIPIARLTFIEIGGNSSQRTEFIYKKVLSIGRGRDVDLQINDSTVSSHHAIFLYRNSQLYLKDEHSANGTFCNGLKIFGEYPINLSQKNIIKMGRTKFVIENV